MDNDAEASTDAEDTTDPICDLIFSSLHVLLLRSHARIKAHRLGVGIGQATGVARPGGPASAPNPAIESPQSSCRTGAPVLELSRSQRNEFQSSAASLDDDYSQEPTPDGKRKRSEEPLADSDSVGKRRVTDFGQTSTLLVF